MPVERERDILLSKKRKWEIEEGFLKEIKSNRNYKKKGEKFRKEKRERKKGKRKTVSIVKVGS